MLYALNMVCARTMERTRYYISRLRNDLYCVGWGVKLYSLTHAILHAVFENFFVVLTM